MVAYWYLCIIVPPNTSNSKGTTMLPPCESFHLEPEWEELWIPITLFTLSVKSKEMVSYKTAVSSKPNSVEAWARQGKVTMNDKNKEY